MSLIFYPIYLDTNEANMTMMHSCKVWNPNKMLSPERKHPSCKAENSKKTAITAKTQ